MAKQRYIDTKMWEDNWFCQLDPIEKLFFIYLLTNPMTNIIGVYELSKGTIGRATGLESRVVNEILERFEKAGKVYYRDGWVVITNFLKNQNYKSPKILTGVKVEMEKVPEPLILLINIPYGYGIDTISHSNTNTNTNSNLSTNVEEPLAPEEIEYIPEEKDKTENKQIIGIMMTFKGINPTLNIGHRTQRNAIKSLIKMFGYDKLKKLAQYAVSIQGQKYAPTITTPYLLQQKISDLKIYYHKNANSQILSI